jgi:pimeloyl-ACP methyl ester carboxylesterase
MPHELKSGTIRASNIQFHALEAGSGPVVLCLHGFPDTPHSFRHQMSALADAGFRAVAPYLRGYAPTEPAPDGRYDVGALAEDALNLIDALGEREAVIFGHDWGAVAAYQAAAAQPQKVRKLITAAVPYGASFFQALATNYAQQRRSWYMFFFQTALADIGVAHNDYEFLEHIWRDWSPGWKWTADDIAPLKECFRKPGTLAAALGYYRATLGPLLKRDAQAAPAAGGSMAAPIDVPTLYFHGRDDGCVGVELGRGMEQFFKKGLRTELVPGAGHFVHAEQPQVVNQIVLEFLKG